MDKHALCMPTPLAPPLTSVSAVLRAWPPVEALSHVADAISSCLERRSELSLAQTCAFGSPVLLDRMWATTPVPGSSNTTDTQWSLRRFLRTDVNYYRYQFTQALKQAVLRGDLRTVQWLFEHFSGCVADVTVVEEAAKRGHLAILQFMWAYGRPVLSEAERKAGNALCSAEMETDLIEQRRNAVEWGRNDAAGASQQHHSDVVWWLLRTVPCANRALDEVTQYALDHGPLPQVQWMLGHGLPHLGDSGPIAGRLDALQWLFERGFRDGTWGVLTGAARRGHLELVQWLVRRKATSDARAAMEAACAGGHLTVVRTLMDNGLGQDAEWALIEAVIHNHLDIAEYLHSCGLHGENLPEAMLGAAKRGHLDAVKWLCESFPDANLFPVKELAVGSFGAHNAMDAAAENGHLPVLQFLHGLERLAKQVKRKRRRGSAKERNVPVCTVEAIDRAASNGHLNVIRWLYCNRDEGWTLRAMQDALRRGHLDVVKWLWEHSEDRFVDRAMPVDVLDTAASNGYLSLVKWLHVYTGVTCTQAAMDKAARNGHLEVVEWLHANRSEGCTPRAMDAAAENGHLAIVQWLHKHRCEGCTTRAMNAAASNGHLHVVRWLHENRWEGCTVEALGSAAARGHFDVLLLLHSRRSEGCDPEGSRPPFISRDVLRWLEEHYPRVQSPRGR